MAFSPDGEWIAYSRLSPVFAYPPLQAELRMARIDGRENRRLARGVGGRPSFSPDGTRVAVAESWNELTIFRWGRDELEVVELPVYFEAREYAWSSDGEELLLIAPDQTIAFYRLESGDLRIFAPPEDWLTWASYPLPLDRPVPARIPVSGYWRVPADDPGARQRYRREYGIGLIDRQTLDARIIVRGSCWTRALDLSADERLLVYSTCAEQDVGEPRYSPSSSVVHLRDLDSDADRALATLHGTVGNLKFSPSGRAIVVGYRSGPLIIRIREGGEPAVLDLRDEDPGPGGGWLPVGWLDDSRLLLARRPSESRSGLAVFWSSVISLPPQIEVGSLAVLDIDTGELRTVFER
jgi:hypothetical protein